MIEVISEVAGKPSELIIVAVLSVSGGFLMGWTFGWARGYRVGKSDCLEFMSGVKGQLRSAALSENIETVPNSRHRA